MSRIHISGIDDPNHSPKVQSMTREYYATLEALEAAGHSVSGNIGGALLLQGVGRAFMPEEMPPTSTLLAPAGLKAQLCEIIQPDLRTRVLQGDEQAITVARQYGRFLAASAVTNNLAPTTVMNIHANHIDIKGSRVDHTVDGRIVEFGMGINGFFTHVENVKRGKYCVDALQKDAADGNVLAGMGDYHGLGDGMHIAHGGLTSGTNHLAKRYGVGFASLVVASRVHGAPDLVDALQRSVDFLGDEGLIVAQGPRRASGTGYDNVRTALAEDPDLELIVNKTFISTAGGFGPEQSRLIVAREVE